MVKYVRKWLIYVYFIGIHIHYVSSVSSSVWNHNKYHFKKTYIFDCGKNVYIKLWLSAPSVTHLNIDKTSYLTTHLVKKFGAYKYSKLASFPNLEYTIVLPDTQSVSRAVWDSREDVS
jgi:hypothetical protein